MISLLKTIILFGIITLIFTIIGVATGGENGLFIFFIFSLIANVFLYLFSQKLVLIMSAAKPIDILLYKDFSLLVEELCYKYFMQVPKLYFIQDTQTNAFATGTGHGAGSIIVTQNIFNILSKEELTALLAHELAHIKNRDVLITSISSVFASIILYPANKSLQEEDGQEIPGLKNQIIRIITQFLLNIAVIVIKIGISGRREFIADKKAAKILKSGTYLSKALLKIGNSTKNSPMFLNPALCSLYFCDPFGGEQTKIYESFSTQPPVEERIKKLEKISYVQEQIIA